MKTSKKKASTSKKKTSKSNYYLDQLSKINFKSDYAPKFKVTDSEGNDTKWMDLNSESIDAILVWLNKEIKESIAGFGSTKGSTSDSLIEEIAKRGTITEKEMKLLLKRKNAGEKFNDAPIWDGEIELSKDQQTKGLKWLKNLWKSPNGKERKNNPLMQREQGIVENFRTMYLRGFHDIGNASHSYWVPLYTVAGDDTTMEYYVKGGQINIVG